MMIKLHVFSGFESEKLKISRETPLGHLYSDRDVEELKEAVKLIGVNPDYLQNSRGFFHYDLWGKPLIKARLFFKIVNNHELYQDLKAIRNQSDGFP